MMFGKVSVIIPCFNAAAYLETTIRSVLDQSYHNLELIIVDDGSTDHSVSIVRSIKDDRIRLITQPNRGSIFARNEGLKNATGQYIQFLDADDILSSDKIKTEVAMLSEYPDALVWCSTIKFEEDMEVGENIDPAYLYNTHDPVEFILGLNGINGLVGMIQPNAYMFASSKLAQIGYFNELVNRSPDDDSEFFSRVILASDSILYDGRSKNFYRVPRTGSLSKVKSREAVMAHFNTVCLKFTNIRSKRDGDRIQLLFAKHLANLAYSYGHLYPDILDRIIGYIKNELKQPVPLELMGGWFRKSAQLIGFRNTIKIKRLLYKIKGRA